ncbi:hypothetical protein ACE6H2_006336 [Prunus campanulata]
MSTSFNLLNWSWIRREANGVANAAANLAKRRLCSSNWVNTPPPTLLGPDPLSWRLPWPPSVVMAYWRVLRFGSYLLLRLFISLCLVSVVRSLCFFLCRMLAFCISIWPFGGSVSLK